MKLLFYKTYLFFINLTFWVVYPITGMLLPIFSSWAKKRRDFELLNYGLKHHEFADFCFEVASEGELEQVMPLLEFFLEKKKYVELVYSSESVEKKVQILSQRYPNHLFYFRLPLITYPIQNLSWIKAQVLILCRYDFYPHLILLGSKMKKFVLLSGSLKGKKRPCQYPYKLFDLIVCASDREKESFEKLLHLKVPLMTMDLRVMRILSRIDSASTTLNKISSYLETIKILPKSNRIILGSAYSLDMKIFENKKLIQDLEKGKTHICIVPHKLDEKSIGEILKNIPIPYNVIKSNSVESYKGVSVVLIPGILCELYTHFGHAFVGGGHFKSIHSVLEPYLTGAQVYCGPKTHRSTEFDFIKGKSPENISVVTSHKDFYDILKPAGMALMNNLLKEEFQKLVNNLENR